MTHCPRCGLMRLSDSTRCDRCDYGEVRASAITAPIRLEEAPQGAIATALMRRITPATSNESKWRPLMLPVALCAAIPALLVALFIAYALVRSPSPRDTTRIDQEQRQREAAAKDTERIRRDRAAAEKRGAEGRAKADADFRASPAGKIQQAHPDWPRDVCIGVADGKIAVGFTAEQVRAAWGAPESINTTSTASGTHEQWVYGASGYVYLESGVVTAIQQSH